MTERLVGLYLLGAIAVLAVIAWFRAKMTPVPVDELPLSTQAIVERPVLGEILRSSDRSAMLPPFVPNLVLDDDGIPTDAYVVMTSLGSANNPHLVLNPTPEGMFAQAWQIPQVIELMPNSERIPWTGIAGVQGAG